MKWIVYILFVALSSQGFAQDRIAYVNTQNVVDAMPEKIQVEEALETFINEGQRELQLLQTELEKQIHLYQQETRDTSLTTIHYREEQLQKMYRDIEQRSLEIEEEAYDLQNELMAPVLEKAILVIRKVSQAKNYQHVFEISTPLVIPKSDNITYYVIEAIRTK